MKKYFWGKPINIFFKKNFFCKLSEIAAIVLNLPEQKFGLLISESNLHLSFVQNFKGVLLNTCMHVAVFIWYLAS